MKKVIILSFISILFFGAASSYFAAYNYIVAQNNGFTPVEREYKLDRSARDKQDAILSAAQPETEPMSFVIRAQNGYLVIYQSDGTFFDYTDVAIADLSREMQIRVLNGLIINSEQRLYEFLENHTS